MNNFSLKRDSYAIIIMLVGILFVLWTYPQLPAKVPTHWNFKGEIDGYTTKPLGAFVGLIISFAIYLGFYLLAAIDPLKKNYQRFNRIYKLTRDIMITFFVILNLLPVLVALGYIKNIDKTIFILISLLMILFGNYMPTFKRNWFLGIKTPWTVSNEEVWNKTHRFGGKLFVLGGVVGLIEALFTGTTYLLFTAIISTSFGSMIYSYFLFRKLDE